MNCLPYKYNSITIIYVINIIYNAIITFLID